MSDGECKITQALCSPVLIQYVFAPQRFRCLRRRRLFLRFPVAEGFKLVLHTRDMRAVVSRLFN